MPSFTLEKLDDFQMQTNFDGLIKLLAEGLYSEPDIFVRELIQNAQDGIVERKSTEGSGGEISIHIEGNTIIVEDDGIGMNESDIREFLAVIGSSHKDRERIPDAIGQFGIGLLSAFVVAEKVYVETLKLGEDKAYEWRNSGSIDCELYSSDKKTVGTKITVFVREDYDYFLDKSRISNIIIKYCDFIPFPIKLDGQTLNQVIAPWHRKFPNIKDERNAYATFISRHFDKDNAIDVFPFEIEGKYKARGVLYITDRHVAGYNTGSLIDIYVRKMLVKNADNELLPSWASFVRGVIDTPDLKPTAARDNIQKSDEAYDFFKKELGVVIIDRLKWLAENDEKTFEAINKWHHYNLKGAAFYYDDFFESAVEFLLFETNERLLSLSEYLSKNDALEDGKAPIYFFSNYNASAHYYRIAEKQKLVVINAGLEFDEQLLRQYAERNASKVILQQFDVMSDGKMFEDLSEAEKEQFEPLEQFVSLVLNRSGLNVGVFVKKFAPQEIPALNVRTEKGEAERRLSYLLHHPHADDLWRDFKKEVPTQRSRMILNANNKIIKALAETDDKDVRTSVALALYNNSILHSQHIISIEDMAVIHDSIVKVMENLLIECKEKSEFKAKLEKARTELLEVKSSNVNELDFPEHIRIFMITPFGNDYENVEAAVRKVFESAPYFFEVCLASDKTLKRRLSDNVRKHIAVSQGFIAEISELNPNVMIEVGAILMRNDNRPVFSLRSSDAKEPVPSDIRAELYIPYNLRADSTETISQAILAAFEKDGRSVHVDIDALVAQRKKKFLSKTVLKSLNEISLKNDQIVAFMKITTVEDLCDKSAEDVVKITGVKKGIVDTVQEELRTLIENGQ